MLENNYDIAYMHDIIILTIIIHRNNATHYSMSNP